MAKAALVTGGAKRIGRAVALALAEDGFDVAVHYGRSEAEARETCAAIRERGRDAEAFPCDLADAEAVAGLVPAVAARMPGLALLVNNASLFEPGSLRDLDLAQYERTMAINLRAPLILARDFAARAAAGQIINLLDQRVTHDDPRFFAYTVTKKALAAVTAMAAKELGPAIRVNGICPGPILPPPGKGKEYLEKVAAGLPLERPGGPADVVEAVRYLVRAAYVTGELLFVDGGEHLT